MSIPDSVSVYWTPTIIFRYVFVATNLSSLFKIYLHWRQYKVYLENPEIPEKLVGFINDEDYNKRRDYGLDKSYFLLIKKCYVTVIKNLVLWFFLTARLWELSSSLSECLGFTEEIHRTIVFFTFQGFIQSLISLPADYYLGIIIARKHSLNRYPTIESFFWAAFRDFIKVQVFLLVAISSLTSIIDRYGDGYFLFLWLCGSLLVSFAHFIYPSHIDPLFDEYAFLQTGSILQSDIADLAKSINYPLEQVAIVNNTARISEYYAVFWGLVRDRQIVLPDALFVRINEWIPGKNTGFIKEEILAIVCRYLGCWHHSHEHQNFVLKLLRLLIVSYLSSLLYQNPVIFRALDFHGSFPPIIGLLIVFKIALFPFIETLIFLTRLYQRKLEFQADQFAKNYDRQGSEDLISGLIKLDRDWARIMLDRDDPSFPVSDWLYLAAYHSRVPILERVNALRSNNLLNA